MKFVGVDIGGMSVKAGIVDENGNILQKKVAKCNPTEHESAIIASIAELILSLLAEAGVDKQEIEGIGIGCPGSIYDEKGVVRYSCNINFRNAPLAKAVGDIVGIKNVKVSNDANCAALGETLFGAGNGAKNSVMVTLGTGVGTGIVVDGKLLTGNRSAGAEGGHMQIDIGGAMCGCAKRGHYEAYASATALMEQTATAIKKYPDSLLAAMAKDRAVDGRLAFDAARQGCKIANNVVKRYIKYVGMGLVNFANIFYPEVIILGGGISNEGDYIVKPLQRYVSRNVYGAKYNPKIKVVAATLKNDAGIAGAAALCM